jgi:flagellar motor protein MotB
MRAAGKLGTLVLVLLVLGGTVLAQDRRNGNIAERQKAPTVLGGTGLFNTFSTRTLCKGEFNFALFWNNFDRDPGDVDINQVPFNFTIGLTNRWELWVDWITWQQTTSRNPFLLSGYQLSAVRVFGDPFTILGPPVGGNNGSTAFFPGPAPALGGVAPLGGILPTLGFFGTPLNFPNGSSLVSPGGANGPLAVGLGPAIFTDRPSFMNELPFFGEVDFFGFDQLGRAVFGPRQSSNGSGDFYVGTKVNLIDPNRNWFSMALGGYVKIPISREDDARHRGRTSGEYEVGPILMLGQESGGHRVRVYENIGYIHTGDIEKRGVKVLNLRDKLLLNAGLSVGINSHVEFVTELAGTVYVGSGTANLNPVNPVDLNIGLRFFFKDGAVSFGGAYRRFLNHGGDRDFSVLRLAGFGPAPPFRPFVPNFDFPSVRFEEQGDPNGFVAYLSVGRRKECPPPPAPTCVTEASPGTVNRGERLTLTVRPNTPGYTDTNISYEYRWEVRDAQGRPVTVSGSGASVEVPTSQLACGTYTATTTVTASVSAVDCPSDCVTTGQTTCTATFSITEPPCPTVSCSVTATPATVLTGERVTLRANVSGEGDLSYSWSTSGGTLSSTTGSEITLDTSGVSSGTISVTLNVSTSRTRCNEPCPGGSCSTSVTINPIVERIVTPLTPCGPIFFPVNSARINNEHKACLDEIALRLQSDPRSSVVIDGHRDSSERVGISLTRANNARDYLVNEKGVDSARITVRNFSDTCPHESGDPALNRRVEFWLIPEGATIEGINNLKRCASGSTPQVVTTEEPAPSVERRTTRRRPPCWRRPAEPIVMMVQPQ